MSGVCYLTVLSYYVVKRQDSYTASTTKARQQHETQQPSRHSSGVDAALYSIMWTHRDVYDYINLLKSPKAVLVSWHHNIKCYENLCSTFTVLHFLVQYGKISTLLYFYNMYF